MNQKQRQRKLQEFKYNAVKKGMKSEATDVAIKIMNTVPLLVLRDKYGFGKKRLSDFADHFAEMYENVSQERLDFNDIAKVIEEETGLVIKLERRF